MFMGICPEVKDLEVTCISFFPIFSFKLLNIDIANDHKNLGENK